MFFVDIVGNTSFEDMSGRTVPLYHLDDGGQKLSGGSGNLSTIEH